MVLKLVSSSSVIHISRYYFYMQCDFTDLNRHLITTKSFNVDWKKQVPLPLKNVCQCAYIYTIFENDFISLYLTKVLGCDGQKLCLLFLTF